LAVGSWQLAVGGKNNSQSTIYNLQSTIKRGIGCSSFHYGVSLGAKGWALDGSGAYIQLFKDGSFSVAIGGIEMGQGVFTAIAQISAETLKVPIEKINILQTDTAFTPDSGPSVASRTVSMSGNAVISASKKLKKEMDRIASEVLNISVDKVVANNGIWFSKDEPNKKISLEALAMECFKRNANMSAEGWYHAPHLNFDMEQGIGEAYFIYTFGTQIAEVEVDIETGEVKVIQLISVIDVGKTINYQGLTGQVEGSGVQGIGYALMENFIMNNGKVITPNLTTYLIPTAMDIADIRTIVVEEPYSRGPYGAKGIGEAALIPVASAIANAVSNATGIDIKSLPITPESLYSHFFH
jgi:CO/xanthine dehydrogenase Mo-binding subunit